jgi:hypothetical protein
MHFNHQGKNIKITHDISHVNKTWCDTCGFIGRPIEFRKTGVIKCPFCFETNLHGGDAEPMKKLEDCFDVQIIGWTVTAFMKTLRMKLTRGLVEEYEEQQIPFKSGDSERQFRRESKVMNITVL